MLTENTDFLDRYHIQHRIGEGAFAEVWLATDENLKREVAIKAVRLLPGQQETKAAVDEAMTLIQFDHPNIIKLYDLVPPKEDDRFVYLIMEYAEGGTLYDLLQRGKLAEEQIRQITLELCAGVEYAHQRGWMHRDLKPKNVFFCRGVTKIGDFGLARIVQDSYRSITASTGTVGYMAPEQFDEGYDKRVDLWALGVIVCEVFTGKQMYQGQHGQIMKQIVLDPIKIPAEIPGGWLPIIEKALQKDPNERYQTAEELVNLLRTSSQKQELLSKAKAAFDNKRYDEAAAFIQQGLTILPRDIDFEKLKGQLDASRKEIWRLSQQVSQQLIQNLDKAGATLDSLLDIDPHSGHVKELRNQLAEALKERKEQQARQREQERQQAAQVQERAKEPKKEKSPEEKRRYREGKAIVEIAKITQGGFLSYFSKKEEEFLESIADAALIDNIMEAVSLCEEFGGKSADVLKTGLLVYSQAVIEGRQIAKEEIREAMLDTGIIVRLKASKVEQYAQFLVAILDIN